MPSLTERVKLEARRLGFHLIGVTASEPPPHFQTYQDWLEKGHHGEMEYLARKQAVERRADPRKILPECQSILVLGVPHQPAGINDPGSGEMDGTGRVAAYAWGQDYHEVLKPRLQRIVSFIENEIGRPVPNRWYTDTGPILERDYAQAAGLGWIGKNSCLISPQMGSFFFLAEILLGIRLDPDPVFQSDHCGSCTRCIDACPTDCILPNRTLAAQKCISYLTIELKGPIPKPLRPHLGDWIFGCDICQQVCPWNIRFSMPEGDPAFFDRKGTGKSDLAEELSLSPQEFNRKFKGSPIKRAKRRGYLRNIAVAMGNLRIEDSIPALTLALHQETEPLVRIHVAWALGQVGGRRSINALENALEKETDAEVRREIIAVLEDH